MSRRDSPRMPTLWWGARPREMKALATVTTSVWYWWYVQLLHSPSLLTVSAILCGARATVSSNMDHTDLAGLLDPGSLPKLSRILTGSSGLIVVNCEDQDHKKVFHCKEHSLSASSILSGPLLKGLLIRCENDPWIYLQDGMTNFLSELTKDFKLRKSIINLVD